MNPTGSPASRHLLPLANHQQHNRHSITKNNQRQDVVQDHRRSPRTLFGASAATVTPRHGSTPRLLCSPICGSGLVSGMQARIAFVSACTYGSVVASFPKDRNRSGSDGRGGRGSSGGLGDLGFSDDAEQAQRDATISGSKGAAYWRVRR